jgi:hypothetical protein
MSGSADEEPIRRRSRRRTRSRSRQSASALSSRSCKGPQFCGGAPCRGPSWSRRSSPKPIVRRPLPRRLGGISASLRPVAARILASLGVRPGSSSRANSRRSRAAASLDKRLEVYAASVDRRPTTAAMELLLADLAAAAGEAERDYAGASPRWRGRATVSGHPSDTPSRWRLAKPGAG